MQRALPWSVDLRTYVGVVGPVGPSASAVSIPMPVSTFSSYPIDLVQSTPVTNELEVHKTSHVSNTHEIEHWALVDQRRTCLDLRAPPTRALGTYSPVADTVRGAEAKNGKV